MADLNAEARENDPLLTGSYDVYFKPALKHDVEDPTLSPIGVPLTPLNSESKGGAMIPPPGPPINPKAPHRRARSVHESAPISTEPLDAHVFHDFGAPDSDHDPQLSDSKSSMKFLYYVVYALVNVIISVPGLYGYAAVIFNHPVFAPHMNALSKLVIFSSLVHQLSFVLFSSMSFAVGTVQDAGLIFLSSMANTIADQMIEDGDSDKAILSTTMVLLSAGTSLLGLILILIGKFKLANVVSYLPMPVVGGYLAFIGYFCVQAGVALCISQPLISFSDWSYVFQAKNLLLAVPGLAAGLVLTWVSRTAKNDATLPVLMVAIPALFYVVIYATGAGLDGAREGGWVGEIAPPVPVSDLFTLVDFSLVRWDLAGDILWTWVGMVFVVSFASCLDVAAISMDKGEALDTNRELATVGIGNFMSGLTFGFTGSYIFSQTIFTYRTGVHSRWIGVMIMVVFLYIVVSPVNILQVAPLFFLGSTLIFIGYDLLYEWLIEIRPRVLLSEYGTIWGTFVAIQIVGVDFGIIVGVLVAILDNVVASAHTTTVRRVPKRSRAVWSPSEYKILHDHAYNASSPKIVFLEIGGPVFFGSSLALLDSIVSEIGLDEADDQSSVATPTSSIIRSPHTSSFMLMRERRSQGTPHSTTSRKRAPGVSHTAKRLPQFCVIDLSQVSSMDASAARTCFLQLSTSCSKRGIVVCATCATPRLDWVLRSHGVSYSITEQEDLKAKILLDCEGGRRNAKMESDRILLFLTIHEALEFCESALIRKYARGGRESSSLSLMAGPKELTLSAAFARILDSPEDERAQLQRLDDQRYHDEEEFRAGQHVFFKGTHPNSFYVVLAGAVASGGGDSHAVYRQKQFFSGAGLVRDSGGSRSNLLDPGFLDTSSGQKVSTLWPVCGVFGYSDLLLDRPRCFGATATQNGTRLARISRSDMNLLSEDPVLSALVHRVLLRASVLDLQNCTCTDV